MSDDDETQVVKIHKIRTTTMMILSDNLGRCAVTVSVIFTLISGCVASHGDSSHPYRKCLKVCHAQLSFSFDPVFHYLPTPFPRYLPRIRKCFDPLCLRFAYPHAAIIPRPTCAFTILNRYTFDSSGGTASPSANTIVCGRRSTHSYAMTATCLSFMASGLSSAGWACR